MRGATMQRDERSGLFVPGARPTLEEKRRLFLPHYERLENVGLRGEVLPPIGGGSFITGTSCELLYSSVAGATELNMFTTEDNLQKTLPPVIIPAGFFYNVKDEGKAIRVVARGRLGTTSAPTFTWSCRLLTSTTWSAGGILLGSTAALTAGTTQTQAPWVLELDIVLRTLAIGGGSTIAALGEVRSPLGLASPFAGTIPANNTAFTVATLDNSVTYYLFLSAACGTSNAANLIKLELLEVFGLN